MNLIQDRTQAEPVENLTGERADLLETLRTHRGFLRFTAQGITDEQARTRTGASELTLGGLIKHVAHTEAAWARFIQGGAAAMESVETDWAAEFRMTEGETVEGLLAEYAEIAAATDALVATADLDVAHPLPVAPWFEVGKSRSVRRVLLHIIAETAQHAGHADIVREGLDGQKTMG
ncbi:DinB family protein [Actinokineospora spheciospongiae]|uniref:DinB family protein n=1 Tax=Actinokineospora spheciospongiae TaxID=909613 RepID=UPI000D71C8DA|nr:DinB family protein [Actinokineospora spheciospongiae]PWW64551.1 uncharacterized protein DUF664 [Actinokineospora spheciospongiae]